MKLEFRPRAVADLVGIRTHLLATASEQAADRVRRHLSQRIERLRKRPTLGISTSHSDIRILSPTQYPYRIYFTVIDRVVVILHIRHTSRRLPRIDKLL